MFRSRMKILTALRTSLVVALWMRLRQGPGETFVRFTVVWKPEAERRLATIWTEATDRNAVTRAAGAIDQAFKSDPEHIGESRGGGLRICLEDPLGVIFRGSPPDRLVSVLTVWTYNRRS